MIDVSARLRIRPSVAMVPVGDEQWQFFFGNTRRSRHFRIRSDLSTALAKMDGNTTVAEVSELTGTALSTLLPLVHTLHEACILEDYRVVESFVLSPWRRVLNFIGDYVPSNHVETTFDRLRGTEAVVLGVGAVGSWVATQLCHTGLSRITLVDDDVVAISNLNRSLYTVHDVGQPKVDALTRHLLDINPQIKVRRLRHCLRDSGNLHSWLQESGPDAIVVNCADSPSVDSTSAIVDEACQATGNTYIIAGGYNLHLSLIGMTVFPGRSACYHCGRLTLEELQGDELVGLRKLARPWRNIGNLAPLAAITASFAANEVIRAALADSRLPPAMLNRRGEFNFLTNEMHFTSLPARPDCGCIRSSDLQAA